ncbi:hypothetical protein SHIRM173S_06753 [Streptomyces hirsutus]
MCYRSCGSGTAGRFTARAEMRPEPLARLCSPDETAASTPRPSRRASWRRVRVTSRRRPARCRTRRRCDGRWAGRRAAGRAAVGLAWMSRLQLSRPLRDRLRCPGRGKGADQAARCGCGRWRQRGDDAVRAHVSAHVARLDGAGRGADPVAPMWGSRGSTWRRWTTWCRTTGRPADEWFVDRGRDRGGRAGLALGVDDDRGAVLVCGGQGGCPGADLEDPGDLVRWATRIAARYMGQDRAEEFGARNGVPGRTPRPCRRREGPVGEGRRGLIAGPRHEVTRPGRSHAGGDIAGPAVAGSSASAACAIAWSGTPSRPVGCGAPGPGPSGGGSCRA